MSLDVLRSIKTAVDPNAPFCITTQTTCK